jgi:hypothetical protein
MMTACDAILSLTIEGSTTTETTDGTGSAASTGSGSGNSPEDQFGCKAQQLKKILRTMMATAKGGKKSYE